jgi:hypothetical protein
MNVLPTQKVSRAGRLFPKKDVEGLVNHPRNPGPIAEKPHSAGKQNIHEFEKEIPVHPKSFTLPRDNLSDELSQAIQKCVRELQLDTKSMKNNPETPHSPEFRLIQNCVRKIQVIREEMEIQVKRRSVVLHRGMS